MNAFVAAPRIEAAAWKFKEACVEQLPGEAREVWFYLPPTWDGVPQQAPHIQ
jgi:hypothetical protein